MTATSLRHGTPGCWRHLRKRDGRWWCEGRNCHYSPPPAELVAVDPLGDYTPSVGDPRDVEQVIAALELDALYGGGGR